MSISETRIPRPRSSPESNLGASVDAITTMTDIYATTRGATPAAAEVAFAALNFGDKPFLRASAFRQMNTQYARSTSPAGSGPKAAMDFYEERGFVIGTMLKTTRNARKHLRVGKPLLTFARSYNAWHFELIQTCQGLDALPDDEILKLALRGYAANNNLSLYNVTAERLATQTNRHPETVTHLALHAWTICQGLAASVKTLRGQRIKEAHENNIRELAIQSVQPKGGLQAVAPGDLVSAGASSGVARHI